MPEAKWVKPLGFVPGSGTLAAQCDEGLVLFDAATGKERLRIPDLNLGEGVPVFTPDGRFLVTSTRSNKALRLWEVATKVSAVVFSPDGKFLVSACQDGTALVWDVAAALALPKPVAPPVVVRTLEELWSALGEEDGVRADAAVRALAARPAEALPLLQARLRPVAPVDAGTVARWVADLDSERFETRARAAKELQALDRLAGPALREALAAKPPPGVRRTVEGLLTLLDGPPADLQQLRALRAVETLEALNTPEARRLLDVLASGAQGARLTEEAQAALGRLRRRSAADY
jgi:hypothetical protein